MSYRVSKRTRNGRDSLSTTPSTIKISPDDEPTSFTTHNAIEELEGQVEDLRNRIQSQAARLEELENQIAAVGGALADRQTQEAHSVAIRDSVARHTSQAARVKALENYMIGLLADKKTQENRSFAVRESVLTSWGSLSRDSISDRRILQVAYSGDICADIEAITKMDTFDPKRSEEWKGTFLYRYGVSWYDCKANDNLRGVSWEMIQVFNMRAYFLKAHGNNQDGTVGLCDAFISIWKDRRDCRVPADQYRRLRDLYYKR